MKTQKEQQTATEQFLALALSQGLEVFEYDDQFYIGCSQEKFDTYEQDLCNNEDFESRTEIDETLKNWIDSEGYYLLEDDFEVSSYDDNVIEYAGGEYLVVDDYTADQLWDQDLDNYLEECIYPELSGNLASYFDDEKWKRDARFDGRAHSLNRYDGGEDSETINDTTYYIYRQN